MFDVFVPKSSSPTFLFLERGSAIVARSGPNLSPGTRLCYYEGNIRNDPHLRTFGGRLLCAAGRAAQNAPTTAKASFDEDELLQVGTYDPSSRKFELTGDRDVLESWLARPLTDAELAIP